MLSPIVLALILGPLLGPIAPHPLVGVWKITYPWHLEVENGVVKPTMETGELKVVAQGDSLIATLATDPSPMFPRRRPIRIAAPIGAEEAVFVMRDSVTVSLKGEQRETAAVSTWILNATGNRLTGSLERRLEGITPPGHGPQPLTGSRVRS